MPGSSESPLTLQLIPVAASEDEPHTIFRAAVAAMPIEEMFPTEPSRKENRVIRLGDGGASLVPSDALWLEQGAMYLPTFFYTEANGDPKRAKTYNVTDWAVEQFRDYYIDVTICQTDIFYYVFAMLHHPDRGLASPSNAAAPVPLITDFWKASDAGRSLAALYMMVTDPTELSVESAKITDTLPPIGDSAQGNRA